MRHFNSILSRNIDFDNSMNMALGPGQGAQCHTPNSLVSSILRSHPRLALLNSFSKTVYDSAWLSMIYIFSNEQEETRHLNLFPQCLDFVLRQQNDDGGWASYGSDFDGILNSLAALLALLTFRQKCDETVKGLDVRRRISKAQAHIAELLRDWKVEETVQVGFEVLVIGLLNQLRSFAVEFEFPGLPQLKRMYELKMKQFVPELIYSRKQTTILHSIEALVGLIDFDQVKHHCSKDTGILGSPAATAAYLIHSTSWDMAAETYLRLVLDVSDPRREGGVPSAFPTPIFELSWAFSSLLSSVMEVNDLDSDSKSAIVSILKQTIEDNHGTAGFSPGLLCDADDTARALMTLQLLGCTPSYEKMIKEFEAADHFRTYDFERNPSFSANCNVLLALLYREDVDQYDAQILKALAFVLQRHELDDISDKWNVSEHYCSMLLAQAFVKTLEWYHAGNLQLIGYDLAGERIPVAVCRILMRTLSTQQTDGDWNKNVEETSYSILTLSQCLRISWTDSTISKIEDRLERGREYIRQRYPHETKRCCLWVEKTMYESALLKMAYCCMALHTKSYMGQKVCADTLNIHATFIKKMTFLLSALPNFTRCNLDSADIFLQEARLLSKYLGRIRQEVVNRDEIPMSKDEYLESIAVIWAACNAKSDNALPMVIVRDMIQISLLNYQIDEYMETIVGDLQTQQVEELADALQTEFSEEGVFRHPQNCKAQMSEEDHRSIKRQRLEDRDSSYSSPRGSTSSNDTSQSNPVKQILIVLHRYIAYVLEHVAVRAAPLYVQKSLAKELYAFLCAHITHNADNVLLRKISHRGSQEGFVCSDLQRNSYFKWVNATGADDTSCPLSFQFFACLISHSLQQKGSQRLNHSGEWFCFGDVRTRYVAEALARRLAAMCRMYNDYGSMARDMKEGNLNSADFAEFYQDSTAEEPAPDHISQQKRKEALMFIAEFERESMELSLSRLRDLVPHKNVLDMVGVLVSVTDTFGLVYVLKDVASSKLKQTAGR